MDRQSGVHPYRPTQRAGANSSRRALVTCVSSTAPPCGARVIGGCGSPGTVPGVRWPNLAAPIRLLLSSIIQPKCRQRGSRLGSCWCRPRSSSPAMRLPLPVVRRELHHETDGSERIEHEDRVLSRGRISACVHKRSSQSSSAAALPANSSASREYTRNISSDLWPV